MAEKYTVIYFNEDKYHKFKVRVKHIISKYGLGWNFGKVKNMRWEEMKGMYDMFELKVDDLVVGRSGSSGIWEGKVNSVKIIMFDKVSEDEHLPVIMMVKGLESEFLREFSKYCEGLGCLVKGYVDEGEGIGFDYVKKVNVGLIEMMNDEKMVKEVLRKNFMVRVNMMREMGEKISEGFVEGWLELIDKYGIYRRYIVETSQELSTPAYIEKRIKLKIGKGMKS